MHLDPQDRDDLLRAVRLVEKKRLIARLTHYAGQPIEQMMGALPQKVSANIHQVVWGEAIEIRMETLEDQR